MYTRADRKPLTLMDLLEILKKHPDLNVSKEIIMSCDEEGNEMLKLYGIEITNKQLTLWPVHS
jgi:hypothetical protein